VFLEVRKDNEPARTLYDKSGWVQCGLRRQYYADKMDAIVMRINLSTET
jgi:ribosomal-protein-alanine N-acetyltransferase